MITAQRRKSQYAKLCKRCQQGYDPSRSIVHGHVMWLHDYVIPCGAAELREKHRVEDETRRTKTVGA